MQDLDPPEWWHGTKITSFEEFITMAKEASPETAWSISCAGARHISSTPPESRR